MEKSSISALLQEQIIIGEKVSNITSKSALANKSHSILWRFPDAQKELHIGNPHLETTRQL